jgi:hypothetical protein
MNRKEVIHDALEQIALEMLHFIADAGKRYPDGWVPATHIKDELQLNLHCYPKIKTQHGRKGWLFSILARMLEDRGLLGYQFDKKHAYYKAL